MNYLPDQMLRNLEPRRLTNAQQREVDEQLGTVFAAISRLTGRVTRRVHAGPRHTAGAEQAARSFRKLPDQGTLPRRPGICEQRETLASAWRK